ncbi:thioredoxin [candidate division KSB1 bacterium]|nr:thioredoxin [candidate division KSB1 bacterium]
MNANIPPSFDEVIRTSTVPVLVDFWAEWCGPCKTVAPTIKKIATEFKNRLLTIKVNVDQKPEIASQYQISGIPTIMLFYQGKILMRLTGAYPYESLRAEVLKHL